MQKKTLSLLLSAAVILLVSVDDILDSNDLSVKSNEVSEDTSKKDQSFIRKDLLLNSETANITLNGIETQKESALGGEHRVKMTIKNKSASNIEVQAQDLLIDGEKSPNLVVFSEPILAGQKAEVSMDILALDNKLPEIIGNLDFTLKILDSKTFNEIKNEKININLT